VNSDLPTAIELNALVDINNVVRRESKQVGQIQLSLKSLLSVEYFHHIV
jgi:hypothetical protein